MVRLPGDCTSARLSAVAQPVVVAQVVPRATPLIRIVEAVAPVPGMKFRPCTASGKLSTAPAKVLEGSMTSMTGPLVMATVADADLVGSATLVAVIEMALGEGAAVGAVNTPVELMEPQAAAEHPWPATAACTAQLTFELELPVMLAKNWRLLVEEVEGGMKA